MEVEFYDKSGSRKSPDVVFGSQNNWLRYKKEMYGNFLISILNIYLVFN